MESKTTFSNCLIYIDLNAHYIPVLGTTVALCGIFKKYMLLPVLNKETIAANRYLSHLSNKSLTVFVLESIPVLGSVLIYLGTRKSSSLLVAIPGLLQRLPNLQKDKEVILKMINNRSWETVKYISTDLLKDEEIYEKILDKAPCGVLCNSLFPRLLPNSKSSALKALNRSWESIRYIPTAHLNDKKIHEKILGEASFWKTIKYAYHISYPISQKDQEILTKILDSVPWEKVKHFLCNGIIKDKEQALKVLSHSRENVRYISTDLLKNEEIYEKILDEAPWEILCNSLFPRLAPFSKNLALKALNRSWKAVKYLPIDFLKDKEIYEKILDEAPYEILDSALFPRLAPNSKSFVLKALNRSWKAVKYLPIDLLKDEEIYEKILDEAPCEILDSALFPRLAPFSKNLALKAFRSKELNRSWIEVVKYLPIDLLKDEEIYEKILDKAPYKILDSALFPRLAPFSKSLALKALNRSWKAIKHIKDQSLLRNEDFALEAIKIDPQLLPYISKNLISDDRFMHSVVVQKPLAKTSSQEMATSSMINLNGLHLEPPLLSCLKDVQCDVRDMLTEFDKNIDNHRDAIEEYYYERNSLEKLCNTVHTSNGLFFTQLSLLLKNILYQWKIGKGLEKKNQHLRALADAATKCQPTWLEVATRIHSELDGSGTPEAKLLTLVQKYKEETILQFTQANTSWHSLNYIRQRYGEDLGLNTTLTEHDHYINTSPSSLTKWQIKALWDARSLLESVHTALSTQEYSMSLYNFLQQITEKNHLAKDKDSIADYVSDNFYNDDYTLNLHAVHVMLIDIGVLEKVF